ncbi:hypothetical protein SAMN05444170_5069 [Bradyrhizobium erythrophlei]|uniref:Uncharacterized protein n=1 Tax=Bradyrhizobium erythrophlei TaxID=1437360 RepID=A0A1M7UHF2_9BRAD|nr:hypothetical protein SAMN05444170_5069 [Bradyrhizobium erythrophlei]
MSTRDGDIVERKQLSPLEVFFVKAGVVTAAIVIVLYFSVDFLEGFVERKADQLNAFKGGPDFWAQMEQKLYALADQPDVPPERKKKIVDALRRLSLKYKPYVDALNGNEEPATLRKDR